MPPPQLIKEVRNIKNKKQASRSTYGSGTIYQKRGKFVSQLTYTIEVNGEDYSKRISGTGSTETKAVRARNENAKEWERALRESLKLEEEKKEKQEESKTQGPTLDALFLLNLSLKDTSVQISTSDNYEMYYRVYVRGTPLGRTPVKEITEEQLLEYYTYTRIHGRKKSEKKKQAELPVKPLSITTINHIRFVISNTLSYALTKGLIDKNPHTSIPPFKAGTAAMIDMEQEDIDADSDTADALHRVIPMDKVEAILDYAFKHSRLAGLFAWAVNSGMREGECLGLKRIYAAPDKDYIFVKKSLAYIRNRDENTGKVMIPKLKKPKNGKERKVPYNQNLKEVYQYQLAQIEREKISAGSLYHDKGLLFADEYGNFLRPWKVLKEFQGILTALGLEKRRFHDLRHTFVSLLVKESQKAGDGISILEVSAIVGHSDPSVTMNIYGGLFPDATEKAMKLLDNCSNIKIPTTEERPCA